MNKFLILVMTFGIVQVLFAQSQDLIIGSSGFPSSPKAQIFDLSDPKAVNMKVSIWGQVRNPGYYIVPEYTDVNTLISFAGGPYDNAKVEDLRLYRIDKDSGKSILLNFNYYDLLWGDGLHTFTLPPKLLPGDILIFPTEARFYLKDIISITVSSLAVVFSILTLVVQLGR